MKKTLRICSIISFAFLLLLLVAAILLFAYQKAYASKIYKNVYAYGNIDLTGKTQKEAEDLLEKTIAEAMSKKIVIKTPEKETNFTIADTGISFDNKKIAAESYKIGRADKFTNNILESTRSLFSKKSIATSFKINRSKHLYSDGIRSIEIGRC